MKDYYCPFCNRKYEIIVDQSADGCDFYYDLVCNYCGHGTDTIVVPNLREEDCELVPVHSKAESIIDDYMTKLRNRIDSYETPF